MALLCGASPAQALTLQDDTHRAADVSGQTVTMSGRAELHLTGGGNPVSGSTVHLNSEDAWVFFHAIEPSDVGSSILTRLRVDGAVASKGTNVRVVQHAQGSVVIPHGDEFLPLTVFTGQNFTGLSRSLRPHRAYSIAELGAFQNRIRSFVLKRGYMATMADHSDGLGSRQLYIAQDADLEVPVLPSGIDADISFIRISPWRWVTKKGTCDVDADALDATWRYNWNIDRNSADDWEYVAIKQQPHWPSTNQNWESRGVNHLSGFNEPDNPVEDAYQNLTPQGSVSDAVARYPELIRTGLRVGAPAVTDGGLGWISDFMSQADAAGMAIDYVPVHYYRSQASNDPAAAASQMYNFLRSVHDASGGRPIWVTEFNNGANWTNNAHDPSTGENRDVVQAMIEMMDDTPWIERYAIYSRVEWFRQTHYDEGGITPMGAMYRDHEAPIAYRQEISNSSKTGVASFLFEGDTRDTSGNGNVCLAYGTPRFVPGPRGQAIEFDGENDHLRLTGRFGDSTDFTFAAWVRWDGGGNWQRIFDFGDGTARYMFLTPRTTTGNLRFAIRNGGGEQQLNAPALTPGVWTHVAVTIAGDTGKLFVGGARVDTNTSMTINPSQLGTEANFLGDSQFSADPLFDGAIDDVRIFNFARSDGRIAAFAGDAAPGFPADLAAGQATVNLPFSGSLADGVSGGTGPLAFEKLDGPGWLAIAADGSFTGVPRLEDTGDNVVLVSVTDANKVSSTVHWTVEVAAPDPVVRLTFEDSEDCVLGNADVSLASGAGLVADPRSRSLLFDGSDDHAVLPEGVASSDAITVATWVRWDGGDAWQRIFDFGNGTDSYLMLSPRSSSNRLEFAIKNGGGSQRLEASQLPAGTWKHVAVTLAGGTGRLYVDGSLVATNASITIKPSDIRPVTNYLGRSQWPDPYFDGRLDEFHIFPRALAQAEIAGLMNGAGPEFDVGELSFTALDPGEVFEASLLPNVAAGVAPFQFTKLSGPTWLVIDPGGRLSGVPGAEDTGDNLFRVQLSDASGLSSALTVTVPVNPPAGLFAHYPFNGDATDRVGGRHGTMNGGPIFREGWYDGALNFDGSNDSLQLPSGIVSGLDDITLAARVRWDGGGQWQRIFDFGNNTSEFMYLTPQSSADTLRFCINLGGTQQLLETARPRGRDWFHVAVTLSGNTGTLYVDGAAEDTGTVTLDPSDIAPTRNYLGASQFSGDPPLDGIIDDFRIYSRALSAAEVYALAVPPPPTVVESGYDAWASAIPFAEGQAGWGFDADRDGSLNAFEWLHGTDPLDPASTEQAATGAVPASALGLAGTGTFLTVQTRVRKIRPGITLHVERATDLVGFEPNAAILLDPPLDDGEFEILTWYCPTPISQAGEAFLRIKATRG